MAKSRLGALAALGLTAVVAGCGGPSTGGSSAALSSSASKSTSSVAGTINVFAAASLTEAFTALGRQFEAAHPGVKVVFNFGASSTLAQQIIQDAPADVFASASKTNMNQVVSTGGAKNSTPFVANVMEIAVPPANPARVSALSDLTKSSVKVALCQSQVPCGATAEKVFTNAKITVQPVTQEADVKSVLSKVEFGEVDAGVVYVTDVRAAGSKVRGIPIPTNVNASTTYPIATLTKAPNMRTAQAFVDYVLSAAGQAVMMADGFARP